MFVLVTYDIDQTDGGKRLRKVAQICEKYGIRVQNSVFEMDIDTSKILVLKNSLENIIDRSSDSVRIYKIGKLSNVKIEIIGKREDVEISIDDAFFI